MLNLSNSFSREGNEINKQSPQGQSHQAAKVGNGIFYPSDYECGRLGFFLYLRYSNQFDPDIVTKLTESCSAFYLYSCKDLSVINLSEAKLYNGSACGRYLSLLVYCRVLFFFITEGFQWIFFSCNRGSLIISLNEAIIDRCLSSFIPPNSCISE